MLYPPALLAATWTILLTLLLATGDAYYPISPSTMIVYLAGVAAFSAGAFFTTHFFAPVLAGAPRRVARRPGGLIVDRELFAPGDELETPAGPTAPGSPDG